SCKVVEAVQTPSCSCDAARGRAGVSAGVANVVRGALKKNERCGGSTGVECSAMCLCEIAQASGPALSQCLTENEVSGFGWCYIDDHTAGGSRFVKQCPPTERQLLRFVGENTPSNGADVFVACRGAT